MSTPPPAGAATTTTTTTTTAAAAAAVYRNCAEALHAARQACGGDAACLASANVHALAEDVRGCGGGAPGAVVRCDLAGETDPCFCCSREGTAAVTQVVYGLPLFGNPSRVQAVSDDAP